MSSIGRIHHVGLTVSDLDRSVAFYTELLGCTQVMGQEKRGGYLGAIVGYPDAHVRMAHLKAAKGDFIIELFEYHQPTPTTVDWEPRVIGCPHVCFLVTDLTAIHHRLVDSGVRFISAPTPIDTGANAGGAGLYLCDPDGIVVELFQRAPGGRTMNTRTYRAVVTGAASGIGRAVATALADTGMDIVGLDLQPCPDVPHRQVDLSDLDATAAAVAELDDQAPVDVFVSCAGIFEGQLAADLDLGTYNRTLAINLHAPVLLMSGFAARMAQRGYGRIVAITSVHVRFSEPTALAYDVGKGGLDAAVRTIAIEHAAAGVLVNAVAPGFVHTGMSIINGVDETETQWFQDSFIKNGRLSMGRVAQPAEIASAVRYLVSDENTYITGTSLTVDGGLSARF